MKKISKFHNNNNSTIYSLNYKFDSVSAAGKFSGTALELIKKYNELAKEAHSNGNYVEMEVFRQYAEHYRKIVTEINERKSQPRDNGIVAKETCENSENSEQNTSATNGLVETEAAPQVVPVDAETANAETPAKPQRQIRKRRNFTVVTVAENTTVNDTPTVEAESAVVAETEKPRRRILCRKPRVAKTKQEQTNAE